MQGNLGLLTTLHVILTLILAGLVPFIFRRLDALRRQINLMRQENENNDVKQSTLKLSVSLLVNYCKTQPVDRLVSYDEIKHIVQVDPRKTREGRAIMRRALKDLLKDGLVFLVKRGYGIYLAKGIDYRISREEDQ
jgi:hypothetical protein